MKITRTYSIKIEPNYLKGYLGPNLSKILKEDRIKQASRNRNKFIKKSKIKSRIKQLLDREVSRCIRRSKSLGTSIAIENPKRLANLRSGKLQGWAKVLLWKSATDKST